MRAAQGTFCLPAEARRCAWSGQHAHPDDLRSCALTGIEMHYTFATSAAPPRLAPLVALLDGVSRATDRQETWAIAAAQEATVLGKGKCRIEVAMAAPGGERVAMASEVRTLLGLKSRQAGSCTSPQPSRCGSDSARKAGDRGLDSRLLWLIAGPSPGCRHARSAPKWSAAYTVYRTRV